VAESLSDMILNLNESKVSIVQLCYRIC